MNDQQQLGGRTEKAASPSATPNQLLEPGLKQSESVAPTREQYAIEVVLKLRHRIGCNKSCRCVECRSLVQVIALAREAVAMKATRKTWRKAERRRIALTRDNTEET